MRVDMHQRPVNYKTAARSFCKQTCFSRFYFWDHKLSCKVASLQWDSLVRLRTDTRVQKTTKLKTYTRKKRTPMHLPRLWTDALLVKTTQVKMQGGTNQMEEPLVELSSQPERKTPCSMCKELFYRPNHAPQPQF